MLFLIFGEMVGCPGGVLQQNNPVSGFTYQFLVSAGAVSTSPRQPDTAPLFPSRLLSSILPLALVTAGILISEVHIEAYLVCWSSSFLTSKGKSPSSISSLLSGYPVCIAATGLYLGLVLFLFFWYSSLL